MHNQQAQLPRGFEHGLRRAQGNTYQRQVVARGVDIAALTGEVDLSVDVD